MCLVRDQTKNILVTRRWFAAGAEQSAITYSRNHPGALVIVSLSDAPQQPIQQYRNGERIDEEEETT